MNTFVMDSLIQIDLLWPDVRPHAWQFEVLVDLMPVASFFVLGGDFWNKLQGLFVRTDRVAESALGQRAL